MPKGMYPRTKQACEICGKPISYVHMPLHARAYHEGQGSTEYFASHVRVRNIKGKPTECEVCHATEGRFYWANLTGDIPNPNDYAAMCASCHSTYDAVENGNEAQLTYIRCKVCNKLVRSKPSQGQTYCSRECQSGDPDWRAKLTGRRPRK